MTIKTCFRAAACALLIAPCFAYTAVADTIDWSQAANSPEFQKAVKAVITNANSAPLTKLQFDAMLTESLNNSSFEIKNAFASRVNTSLKNDTRGEISTSMVNAIANNQELNDKIKSVTQGAIKESNNSYQAKDNLKSAIKEALRHCKIKNNTIDC